MFIDKQPKETVELYTKLLFGIASLSKLFSDDAIPYLPYRTIERSFCYAFKAEDLSRKDIAIDALKLDVGVGIKTFMQLSKNVSSQKVAEFNTNSATLINLPAKKKVENIVAWKNQRVQETIDMYEINSLIYHCVIRDAGIIKIYEYPMDKIDINTLKITKQTKTGIFFQDNLNKYRYYESKSVLLKEFNLATPLLTLQVNMIDDPLKLLASLK